MRQLFETGDNESDFEVFENKSGTITFKTENQESFNGFIFTMDKNEISLLIDRLNDLLSTDEPF